jgi:hypothetical protein
MIEQKLSERSLCVHLFSFATSMVNKMKVKVKNKLDATNNAVLLPQRVSGTDMPIVGSTVNAYLPLLCGHTWKPAWGLPH